MIYTAECIDVEAFEKGLREHREAKMYAKMVEIAKAEAFFSGYETALDHVRDMFHCSNYESSIKKTEAYAEGVSNAIYEICKELDIPGQDIRSLNTGVDEKASILADRIRAMVLSENDAGQGEQHEQAQA